MLHAQSASCQMETISDATSLCCVLCVAELDVPEVIGRECVAMTRLQRQAADAFSVLETAQANLVSVVPRFWLLSGNMRKPAVYACANCLAPNLLFVLVPVLTVLHPKHHQNRKAGVHVSDPVASMLCNTLCSCAAVQVMSKRKLAPGSPRTALRQLARDCTEQLGVYAAVKKRDTRLDQWNKNLPLAPLR